MRTLHEYEPTDIKVKDFAEGEKMDEVHSFLMAQIFVIGLTGFKPRPGDPTDPLFIIQRHIADFLNAAQKSGISITKAESVPEAFRQGIDA